MKIKHPVIGTSLMFLAFSATYGNAAEITWGIPATITEDANVSNNGEIRVAINAAGTDVTVNGVTFVGLDSAPTVATSALPFTSTINNQNANVFQRGALIDDPAADDISDLIFGGFFGTSTAPTAITTFTDLVVGQDYEIQVFANDARGDRDNFLTRLDNGLDATDPLFLIDAVTLSLANEADGTNQGDFVTGTFTADATTQSFGQQGTLDDFANFNNSRIQINAIQLRAVGEIIPIPDPEPNFWTGNQNGDLDSTTNNFALNEASDPLVEGNLNNINADNGLAVFGDSFFDSGIESPVNTSTITIPAGAQPTANTFSFINSAAVDYVVTSTDTFGIVGLNTGLDAEGDGTLTLLGTHLYEGLTSVGPNYTLELGNAFTSTVLSSENITASGNIIYDTSAGDVTFAGEIIGNGNLTKNGLNNLTLEGNSIFNGSTTLTQGTLTLNNFFASSAVQIDAGAVADIVTNGGGRREGGTIVYTGGGILRKSGIGQLSYTTGNFQLSAGATIDVVGGLFTGSAGGTGGSEIWTDNFSNLNIEAGATFSGVEGNVRFDAITGEGIFSTGFASAGYIEATIGVSNGSGTFDGPITDFNADLDHIGNIRKIGTGTQTLNGLNTYTGNTVIEDGELIFTQSSSLAFVPLGDQVVNTVSGDPTTGTGSFTFDGTIAFDLSNADTTLGNEWTIVDPTNLASVSTGLNVVIQDSSTETLFTESLAQPGVFELTTANGDTFTYNMANFTLSLGEPIEPTVVDFGFNTEGGFEISYANLDPSITYQLRRSTDITSGFTTDVGPTFSGAILNTFIDDVPPAERAFYQLFDVTP